MQTQSKKSSQSFLPNSNWFDNLIEDVSEQIRCHELQLDTNTASEKTKAIYEALKNNDYEQLAYQNKLAAQKFFIKQIVLDFALLINGFDIINWAVAFNDSKVFTWIVVNDDDEQTEGKIILAEAKINAKYHEYGYDLVSTIIEKSDNIPVPNHYSSIEILEQN